MPRILLRSAKDPFEVVRPELALALYSNGIFGRNVGNLVFGDAVHRLLSVPGTEVISNSYLTERSGVDRRYIDRLNAEFDHFVIPLANAFRLSFQNNLERLSWVIERLRIPTTVVGVGVVGGARSLENPIPDQSPTLNDAARRFVAAVLDRSASIGVRGEFTREYLARLGFGDEHVDVIGCPSLFRDGGTVDVVKRVPALTAESRFTMNLSPYVRFMGAVSVDHATRYPNMVYIPQGNDTLELMLWGTNPAQIKNPKLPVHTGHVLYRENRMRFFVDSSTWSRYLAGQEFAFGTRIHGNISALLAGTPAHVLAHDARTLEIVRYHDIPHTEAPAGTRGIDAAGLYAESDFARFNAGQAERFAIFATFLRRNGLEHVYEEGKANPSYDERLAGTPFPPPVETLYSRNPDAADALVERLGSLYRDGGERLLRRHHEPHHQFPLTPQPERHPLHGVARRVRSAMVALKVRAATAEMKRARSAKRSGP
jgi:Polysaccharide pyruvyl transferase